MLRTFDSLRNFRLTNCTDNTSDVKSGGEIIKPTLVPQNGPQFASQTSLH